MPTLSDDLDEQLKPTHKVVDVVDRPYRKICAHLLLYIVEKPVKSYAQVRLLARKKEEMEFPQDVYVNYKLEKLVYILDVMNSVKVKVIINKHCFVIPEKVNASNYLSSFSFHSSRDGLEHCKEKKQFSRVEIKIGTLSGCPQNFKKNSRKNYTNCS